MNETSSFTAHHVRTETSRDFAEVKKDLEQQLGRFDAAAVYSSLVTSGDAREAASRIEAMAGPSGSMLFGMTDHGTLLRGFGEPNRAVQYLVGNPLIAMKMTRRNLAAGLYAPRRMLIYEQEGKTVIEYDKPPSLFGQFGDPGISAVAATLDEKLETLVAVAIG